MSASGRRIVVIGASGQLGSDLMRVLADQGVVGLAHSQVEITQPSSVVEALNLHRPQLVINAAAYNRVDDCDLYPNQAFLVNAVGVFHVATACRELGATLVHFSTDYVFDGAKAEPYTEEDQPRPINAYGISKLAGEYFVRYLLERHFIIRTSGLYGRAGSRSKGGNFVERMLRLAREGRPIKVVDDQTLTPTYTLDLAWKVKELISTDDFGLYHITSQGSCTWHNFARKIFEFTGVAADLSPTTSQEHGDGARRPRNSVLQNLRLQRAGLDTLRPWEDALRAYLAE